MSEELRKLHRKKKSAKCSIDVIDKYVQRFDPNVYTIRQVQTRLTKLEGLLDDLDILHEAILDLDQGDEDKQRRQFEDEMSTLKANMEDLIDKHSNITQTTSDVHHEPIRLPTIQPPSFSGNSEDWSSFFDAFNALFHNNNALTDVQRLHYLKSSVLGPAADIVKNFTITADNYRVAYQELIRDYENKGFTIQSHIRTLLITPKITVASADELRKLPHHVASHVRALKAIGQPVP